MTHDVGALRALEFGTVIREIAALATCEPGRTAVEALQPKLGDRTWAQSQLALVEDVVAFFDRGGDLSFGGAIGVRPQVEQAVKGSALAAPELRRLADTEHKLRSAVRAIKAERRDGPLAQATSAWRATDAVLAAVDRGIDADGKVADGASAKLAAIRRTHRELGERVRERCRAMVASAQYGKLLSEPLVTVRAGRYVVPVRSEHASQFPGVVLDQSASGATVFMEPLASVEANNRLRTLEAEQEREIARILLELTALVANHAGALVANAELLEALDCAGARARFARARSAVAPALSEDASVRIVHGRHPLLRREAVPLDFELGESFDAVVISGPNMGGKTVVLKTVGLLCLLAYAGVPIPASASSSIGAFGNIECIIGDEQSITADLSSFSAHLRALNASARAADRHTLVLVDEIGAGTEPAAGAALAQAFVESLIRAGAKVAVTTHFTQLKTFAATHDRVRNASMLFDPATHAPTFIFALGVPGQSLAFALARALAVDGKTIARAETLLGVDAQNLERTFAQLAAERERLKEQQTELADQTRRGEQAEQALRKRAGALEEEKHAFTRRADAQLAQALAEVRRQVSEQARERASVAARQAAKPSPGDTKLLAETLAQMRRSLGLEASGAQGPGAASFRAGDKVFVKGFDAPGVVSEVYDRDLLVLVGSLKTLVPARDVTRTGSSAGVSQTSKPRATKTNAAAGLQIGSNMDALTGAVPATSIDVRGMTVDEAWPLVDKALDDASLCGLAELRIVHGKGTGRLARGIHDFLREHPQVDTTSHPADREGGSGVTIVRVK